MLSVRSPIPVPEEMISLINSGGPLGLWETDPFAVNAYFSARNARLERQLEKLFPGTAFEWRKEESRDWVKEYEESLNPIKVGKRFVITPFSDIDNVRDLRIGSRTAIKLVPGEAFGTGEHYTTSSSIAMMEKIGKFPSSVIDVGTGTGVLAIAARHLGAKRVFACDIDPVACRVARETIEMNRMKIPVFASGPEAVSGKFGLVIANILAQTLIDLSRELTRLNRQNGYLILSGISVEMGMNIKAIYSSLGYRLLEASSDGEWWTMLFARVSRGKTKTAI